MKKYILLLLICFVAASVAAQEKYTVVQVNGKVLKADSSTIIPGTKLTLNDQLIFPATGGQLILANPQKGRLLVKPEAKDKKGFSFIVLLSEYMDMHKEWIKKSGS